MCQREGILLIQVCVKIQFAPAPSIPTIFFPFCVRVAKKLLHTHSYAKNWCKKQKTTAYSHITTFFCTQVRIFKKYSVGFLLENKKKGKKSIWKKQRKMAFKNRKKILGIKKNAPKNDKKIYSKIWLKTILQTKKSKTGF